MRTKMKRLTSFVAVLVMTIAFLANDFAASRVQALTEGSNVSDEVSLNVICKYLYLGIEGKDTFDFNVGKNSVFEGATYYWYIRSNKGNPDSVIINSKTGVVTAKAAGTAYIRCKITLNDGTVLRPEAKVVVINSITGVAISNIPENQTIEVGKSIDFDRTVLNTMDGKSAVANGITRWEIAGDTAGVGNASDDGIVTPSKAGEFSIRAVCFARSSDYRLWSENKEAYADKITAASDWVKITVTHVGIATTPDQLAELLKEEDITKITFATQEKFDIILLDGSYLNKTLIVDAPNAFIENHAYFKDIILKPANYTIWLECVSGNNLTIMDKDVLIYATDTADIEDVQIDTAEAQKASENSGETTIKSFDLTIPSIGGGTNLNVITGQSNQTTITQPGPSGATNTNTGGAVILTQTGTGNLIGSGGQTVTGGGSGNSIQLGNGGVITGGLSNGLLIGSGGVQTGLAINGMGAIMGSSGTGTIISGGSNNVIFAGSSSGGLSWGSGSMGSGTLGSGRGTSSGTNATGSGSLSFYSDRPNMPIAINSNSTVTLSGTGSFYLNMAIGAAGSTITSTAPVQVGTTVPATFNLGPGSDGSVIVFTSTAFGSQVYNNSGKDITVGIIGSNGSGSSAVIVHPGQAAAVTNTGAIVTSIPKTTPVASTPIAASSIIIGQPLSAAALSGGFKDSITNLQVWGTLTWDNPTMVLVNSGEYNWTFTPTNTASYNVVKGTTLVYVLPKATPVIGNSITATMINEGQTLSASVLSGSFKDSRAGVTIRGTLTWDNPTAVINTSGSYGWTFTPTDTDAVYYKVVSGTAAVQVNIVRVTPVTGSAITATAIMAGQSLSASALSGSFQNGNTSQAVAGTLLWDNPEVVVNSTGSYGWTFTPSDTVHYNVVKGTVTVQANIERVTPVLISDISVQAINAGESMSSLTLRGIFINSDTQQRVEGTLTWYLTGIIAVTNDEFTWIFTPFDTVNYTEAVGTVNISVIPPESPQAWLTAMSNAVRMIQEAENNLDFNLNVSDESVAAHGNTQEKQSAVEDVISGLQLDVDSVSVIWDDYTLKYDIVVRNNGELAVTSITPNFYYSPN